jgi:hypothetical protein
MVEGGYFRRSRILVFASFFETCQLRHFEIYHVLGLRVVDSIEKWSSSKSPPRRRAAMTIDINKSTQSSTRLNVVSRAFLYDHNGVTTIAKAQKARDNTRKPSTHRSSLANHLKDSPTT